MRHGYESSGRKKSESTSFISSGAQSRTDQFALPRRKPFLPETVDRLAHRFFLLSLFSENQATNQRGMTVLFCPLTIHRPDLDLEGFSRGQRLFAPSFDLNTDQGKKEKWAMPEVKKNGVG